MKNEPDRGEQRVAALVPDALAKAPWFRIPGGWAVNLDGSDPSLVHSLPRVEVRSVPAGWIGECFFADGGRAVWAPPYPGGAATVMAETLERARGLLASPAPASEPAR